MNSEQVDTASKAEPKQEVDRIREIIFGSQMRDYDQRFKNFTRDLDRLQKELDRLTEQFTDQDNAHTKKLQALRRDMRKADRTLRDEIREATQKITTDILDRETLGEMFMELGTQIKTGGSLAELLQSVSEPEE